MFSLKYGKGLLIVLLIGLVLIPNNLVFAQSSAPTEIGIFQQYSVNPDTKIEVPVEIKNVTDLYAFDITLKFDPSILQVQDANTTQPGIQVALGKFLDGGLVLFNSVDNANGTIHFVMTQANPSEPKSGDGNLIVVYFKGIKTGESAVSLSSVQLSTRDGMEISSTSVNSTLAIDANAAAPAATATSIPVQDSANLVTVPTMAPTIAPTEIPTATLTPLPTSVENTAVSKAVETPIGIAQTGEQTNLFETAQLFLLAHWWIVLVLAVIIIVLAIYLIVSFKNSKDKETK